MHNPGLGDGHEKQVKGLERVGDAGHEPAGGPAVLRSLTGLAVEAVVVADHEPAELMVEIREGQPRWGHGSPLGA
jgi:hypothetical protein